MRKFVGEKMQERIAEIFGNEAQICRDYNKAKFAKAEKLLDEILWESQAVMQRVAAKIAAQEIVKLADGLLNGTSLFVRKDGKLEVYMLNDCDFDETVITIDLKKNVLGGVAAGDDEEGWLLGVADSFEAMAKSFRQLSQRLQKQYEDEDRIEAAILLARQKEGGE